MRGARHVLNVLAQEIKAHALCVADQKNLGNPTMRDEDIMNFFVPSVQMLLNYIAPLKDKKFLPESWMYHRKLDPENGLPAFAQCVLRSRTFRLARGDKNDTADP
jgi:hypothetical protein